MNREKLVDLIINDPEEFKNVHSKDSSLDVSESDFSHKSIEDMDLSNIDFSNTSFMEGNYVNCDFSDCDLTNADFSRASVTECNFSGAILNGATFNYATVSFSNFSDSDLAGCNFSEADLSDSDFSTSENLESCRFDESTIWPDSDKLPEDFDCTYNYDLSSLREDDEENSQESY